jgi:hypothetical protein
VKKVAIGSSAVVMAAALSFSVPWTAAASAATNSSPCAKSAGVQNVTYTITTPNHTVTTVTELKGNVAYGDTVTANFGVPAGCAGEQVSLASYDSGFPITDLADQQLYSSDSNTFGANGGSLTVHVVPAPTTSGVLTLSGSMEGNLPVKPGDTLRTGYDFTIPGAHPAETVYVSGVEVTLTVDCPDGSTEPIAISLPNQVYQVPAGSSDWYPSGDQSSSLVYQGSFQVPATSCGGATGHAPKGANFVATFSSTVTSNPINVRFHYADNTAGSWSGTPHINPPSPPNWQLDFVTGPVLTPPTYRDAFIEGATGP